MTTKKDGHRVKQITALNYKKMSVIMDRFTSKLQKSETGCANLETGNLDLEKKIENKSKDVPRME